MKSAFQDLIAHKVAVTSTLAVFDGVAREDIPACVLELLSVEARELALTSKVALGGKRKEMRELVRQRGRPCSRMGSATTRPS